MYVQLCSCFPSLCGERVCKLPFMSLGRQGRQAQGPGEKPGRLLVSLEGSACSPSVHWAAGSLFWEIPLLQLYSGEKASFRGLWGKSWIWGIDREV